MQRKPVSEGSEAVIGNVSRSEKEITTYHGKTAHACLDNTAHTLNRQSKQTPD
jgi:hypothetical protein